MIELSVALLCSIILFGVIMTYVLLKEDKKRIENKIEAASETRFVDSSDGELIQCRDRICKLASALFDAQKALIHISQNAGYQPYILNSFSDIRAYAELHAKLAEETLLPKEEGK